MMIIINSRWQSSTIYVPATMLAVFLAFPEVASARPVNLTGVLSPRQTSTANQAPIAASSDVWATVIANVAPIMTLVGERNAKEFLRVSSSYDQLFLMATAPLGILSLMISMIRLSGPPVLRRLTGREADPKSEALFELTPLSVAPATSVYTQHAVEIKPSEQRDEAAFVCAHIKQTTRVRDALSSFKHILRSRVEKANGEFNGNAITDQEDYEVVLGMKGSSLTAEETANLVSCILDKEGKIEESVAKRVESTSLSFRTTGISPTQTAAIDRNTSNRRALTKMPVYGNIFAGICAFIAMGGVQVAGYCTNGVQIENPGLKTLIMGLVGYCSITVFTFVLLVMIKQEIRIEPQDLQPIFDDANAVWTFSDSRHAQHRIFDKPLHSSLVQAAPKRQQFSKKRHLITCFISAALIGSYVVYYLGIRVAVWWVAFGELMITWLSAAFRAWAIRGFLKANDKELGEHWLGIFRDDLSKSLLETVATMEDKQTSSSVTSKSVEEDRAVSRVSEKAVPSSSPMVSEPDNELKRLCPDASIKAEKVKTKSCTLIVAKPTRQSLRNWSGSEDIMKVALEMAKHVCRSHVFGNAGEELVNADVPSFRCIIRFRLMVYVPGVLWRANSDLDYIMTEEFDLPNLYRDILKIFHLCSEVNGTITRHEALTEKTAAGVSNVLCGPLALTPVPTTDPEADTTALIFDWTIRNSQKMTLTQFLVKLRNQNPVTIKAYTLDQSLLLPTIQLAAMYESYCDDHQRLFSRIQQMQNGHTDKLCLSGSECLGTLEAIFEENKIWHHFMEPKPPQQSSKALQQRDEKSGLYGKPARKNPTMRAERKESSLLQDRAFRNRPGNPGQ